MGQVAKNIYIRKESGALHDDKYDFVLEKNSYR
jgi:hypothetical protein